MQSTIARVLSLTREDEFLSCDFHGLAKLTLNFAVL